ncbi:hypothetical protein JTB14_010799 [Gonioctena quinquepunctata]|nr:hypothetical protein JTB14_010799 [Gonioctena quinquepunctata]
MLDSNNAIKSSNYINGTINNTGKWFLCKAITSFVNNIIYKNQNGNPTATKAKYKIPPPDVAKCNRTQGTHNHGKKGTTEDGPYHQDQLHCPASAPKTPIQQKDNHSIGAHNKPNIVLKKLAADFGTFCVQNQRKQNMLTSILTDLLSEVKSLKNIITEINVLRISDTSNMRTESIFKKLKLPASTLEEFNEIENYLQPQENFTNVVREVSKMGGNSPFEFVKRVMLQFMTYKTATFFTWYGRKEKLCFKDTKMSQIILGSSEAIGDRKQMEEALQKFFRRAKERSLQQMQHRNL